jgi:hypothetical protein
MRTLRILAGLLVLMLTACVSAAEPAPAAQPAPAAPLTGGRWLPVDKAGWTILKPAADSRLIYVSASEGKDETAQVYKSGDKAIGDDPTKPAGAVKSFKTIAAAMKHARDEMPDWVLLKRGDTWIGVVGALPNGRDAGEPFVLTAFGDRPERPVIKSGAETAVSTKLPGSEGFHDVAIVGLDFYAHTRDPKSPDYKGLDGAAAVVFPLRDRAVGERVLLEDCRVRHGAQGVSVEVPRRCRARGVVLRRNVIVDSYSRWKSQGVWACNSSLLLEENVFDHNGWSRQAETAEALPENDGPRMRVDGNYCGKDGEANMLNHNTYMSGMFDTVFRGNIFLRPSSIQNKFTAGWRHSTRNLTIDNNLYVDGEIGISVGGNRAGPLRWKDMRVINNVMLDIGRSHPTKRHLAWYLDIQDWDGGLVAGNLMLHQRDKRNTSTCGIWIRGTAGKSHTRNVTIRDNVVYGLSTKLAGLLIGDGQQMEAVTITGNQFQFPGLPTTLLHFASGMQDVSFRGNVWWSGKDVQSWFVRGRPGLSYKKWTNESAYDKWPEVPEENLDFKRWQGMAGARDSVARQVAYPEPTRDIQSYMKSLGQEPSIEAFIREARKQSKSNWRKEFTAEAVNDWIRAGFGKAERVLLPEKRTP